MDVKSLRTLQDIEDDYVKSILEPVRDIARIWLKEFERLDKIAVKELGGAIHTTARMFILHFFNLDMED